MIKVGSKVKIKEGNHYLVVGSIGEVVEALQDGYWDVKAAGSLNLTGEEKINTLTENEMEEVSYTASAALNALVLKYTKLMDISVNASRSYDELIAQSAMAGDVDTADMYWSMQDHHNSQAHRYRTFLKDLETLVDN